MSAVGDAVRAINIYASDHGGEMPHRVLAAQAVFDRLQDDFNVLVGKTGGRKSEKGLPFNLVGITVYPWPSAERPPFSPGVLFIPETQQ